MKKQCFLLMLLLAVSFGVIFMAPVAWGEGERFQAVRLANNAVFILDTKEGHLWVWVTEADPSDKEGRTAEFLTYEGQVRKGDYMGDLIGRTYRPEKGRSLGK